MLCDGVVLPRYCPYAEDSNSSDDEITFSDEDDDLTEGITVDHYESLVCPQ